MKSMFERAPVRGGLTVLVIAATVALAAPPAAPTPAAAGRIPIGGEPTWATRSALQGRAAPDERMDLRFHLRLRNRDAALAEAEAVTDPDSPRYGQFLSTEQFCARYAPTAEDAAAGRAWLEARGLTYEYEAGNRLILAAHGTVAQIEAAFQTPMGRYRVREATLRAPTTAATIPAELSALVTSVGGLHDEDAALQPTIVRRGGSEPPGRARVRSDARTVVEGPPGVWTAHRPPASDCRRAAPRTGAPRRIPTWRRSARARPP